MMSKLFKIFLILLISSRINAQDVSFFRSVDFGKSFVSDTRSPITKLETGFLNKISPYYYKEDVSTRPFIEAHTGYEIPVFSVKKNNFELGFNLPGGTVTLVDMFEKETAPVINTDFWFGTRVKLIKRFSGKPYIKNFVFDFIPVYHESTHLGDEFVLHGYYEIPDFKRINISYEAWKLSFTLNDADTLSGNNLSLKAAVQNLWTIKDGWYFTDSLEVKGSGIPASEKTFEYYFSFDYQRRKGFLCSKKFVNVFSAEISNRVKLSYDYDIAEEHVWSYNLYFGWKYEISDKAFRNAGLFLRYYAGINPHGQFRNENNYGFAGISLVLM